MCLRCSEDLGVASFAAAQRSPFKPDDQLCQLCRLAPPPFQRAVAYGGYAGTLRALIHALKYDGMLPVAERLGAMMAESLMKLQSESSGDGIEGALVVAVPMYVAKQKQRGFNHAELIAKAAVKEVRAARPSWSLRMADGLLERRRATRSQAGLSPHQRRANLRGVFLAPDPERLKGRTVLLIDDIYTTGATARACSQALRRAGAASVWVATVARPQREILSAPSFEELPMEQDVAFWGAARELKPAMPRASLLEGERALEPQLGSESAEHRGRNVFGQRQSHD